MLLALGFLAGFVLGWWRARARGHALRDRVHFAVIHGILGLLAGLAATLGLALGEVS